MNNYLAIGFGGAGNNLAKFFRAQTGSPWLAVNLHSTGLTTLNADAVYVLNEKERQKGKLLHPKNIPQAISGLLNMLEPHIQQHKIPILFAGLGGRTGSLALLAFVEVLHSNNIAYKIAATLPFPFEGQAQQKAEEQLQRIKQLTSAVVTHQNFDADDELTRKQLSFCDYLSTVNKIIIDKIIAQGQEMQNNLIQIIQRKFEEAQKTNIALINEKGINAYNPLLVLRKKSEENGLHSNLIYSLINPNGNHYQGTLFLKRFIISLETCIPAENIDEELSDAVVHREKQLNHSQGRIDILIELKNYCMIIENKIYAADQPNQINRYIKACQDQEKNKQKTIIPIYLTPKGAKPSKNSFAKTTYKNVTELYTPSYEKNILQWCETCQNEKALENHENLRLTLQQYASSIKKLFPKKIIESKFEVLTNEQFFLNLTHEEQEVIFQYINSKKHEALIFLTKNLIPNSKPLALSQLIEKSLNYQLSLFIDSIEQLALDDGLLIANTGSKFPQEATTLLKKRNKWFNSIEGSKDTRNNKLIAISNPEKNNTNEIRWASIYFAKTAAYIGIIKTKDGATKKINKSEYETTTHHLEGFSIYLHSGNPLKEKFYCTKIDNIQHPSKDGFDIIKTLEALKNPKNLYEKLVEILNKQ